MKPSYLLPVIGCVVALLAPASSAVAEKPLMHPPVIVEERAYVPGHFSLEIDGVRGSFVDVAGMGGISPDDASSRKLAGLHKFTQLILKRGYAPDNSLFKWWQAVGAGRARRRSVHAIEIGGRGRRVEFHDCLVSSYVAPAIDPKNSAHATEQVTLRCEGYRLK